MEIIEAKYTIVTPMFLGGANQSPSDGIRPPSVKGALRFWWRALNWGKFWKKNNENETEALKALHQEEARLFGAAMGDKDNSGGQGCFLLSVPSHHLSTTEAGITHRGFHTNDAARYLGYGLMEAFSSRNKGTEAGELVRGCINENQSFIVRLVFKSSLEPSIKEALIALGLLGGLGSRSRHGLGSLTLEELIKNTFPSSDALTNIWTKPTTKEAYTTAVRDLLNDKLIADNPTPYTCFDKHSRLDTLDQTKTPYIALDHFGRAMLMYRSWGKNGLVLGQSREKEADDTFRFEDDHDWSKGLSRIPRDFHPERAIFGLPHNYGQGEAQSVTTEHYERRSSPLLLHIHQLTKNSFLSTSIFLPSLFLPSHEKIKAGRRTVPNKTDYAVITRFLDNPTPHNKPRFPNKQSIIKGI